MTSLIDKEKILAILNEPFESERGVSEEKRKELMKPFWEQFGKFLKEEYNEYHKQYEEGRRKANYNLNSYPIGSKKYISFNQGVASVLNLSND